ncbi:MAG: stage sporulation protein [Solirubrobacteraceae bacterium]|nr:stage sporulation protein [Solirubrobacteraceae bacterium]
MSRNLGGRGRLSLPMRRSLLVLTPVLALALAAPASATVRVDGRGWGHGIGLSQYGAYGYALEEARDHAWILQHFYPGTDLTHGGSGRVRVRLTRSARPALCGATRLRDARGRRLALTAAHVYRVSRAGGARYAVRDVTSGHLRARVAAPATVSGGASWCLRGRADNGVRDGAYRGSAQLLPDGRRILVVNRVGLESYLRGVVGAEMPASWPAQALQVQAVIARSYALRARAAGAPYDLFADTRSQVYGGVGSEVPAASAAVRASRGEVVTYGGEVAQTFFFSSSGGQTAANEEIWGTAPVPYLRSVADPYDRLSPYHRWTVTFRDREAARRLADVSPGALRSLKVVSRTASGRAAVVAVRGKRGTARVAASTIQSALGLRSTWFWLR